MYEKGMNYYEEVPQSISCIYPVHRFGSLPDRRRCCSDGNREVMEMEGFANLISMMDYVLDTKRKRHITGGILLSAALLFGGLAITVISIKDEQVIEVEDVDYE